MPPRPYPRPQPFRAPPRSETPKPLGATVASVLDTSLIPGRSIEPIDLPNALRLAGLRELDIAIARRRVNQSIADLQFAWAQWLPSLFLGPTWYRADGQVQTVTGQVQNVNRSSLFIGGRGGDDSPWIRGAFTGNGLHTAQRIERSFSILGRHLHADRGAAGSERQQGRGARRK